MISYRLFEKDKLKHNNIALSNFIIKSLMIVTASGKFPLSTYDQNLLNSK